MAKATKLTPPDQLVPIALELTPEEATTLAVILSRISGDPYTTARKHASAIACALRAVGYSYEGTPESELAGGGIEFRSYEEAEE